VGQLQYFINQKLNTKVDLAWDPNYHRFNTSNVSLQYNDNAEKVVNFWYNYSTQGPSTQQVVVKDLSLVGFSLGWKLLQHWNIFSNLEYNISYHRVQNYLYGLEYDSCCWAIRLVRDGTYIGREKENYESKIYLQFVLKGLGSRDLMGNLEGVLSRRISGYGDKHDIGL
jgi:LPS-assembly protein